jgi:hypothetical protein
MPLTLTQLLGFGDYKRAKTFTFAHIIIKHHFNMNKGDIILYQNQDGNIKIDVRLEDETVWLTQEQMALLFGKGRSTVTEHIGNVYQEGELESEATCRKFQQDVFDA